MRTRVNLAASLVATLLIGGHTVAAGPEKPIEIWPNGAPGERGDIGPEKELTPSGKDSVQRITNVSVPTITLYRPETGKGNGCAVVVCPGGGYNILAYEHEGTEVAEWLNSFGVTAVLLKYRVPRRDPDAPHRAPLQDAQRAIRLTRSRAADSGIDPKRVGILGFSAGGNLAVMASTHWRETTYDKVDEADRLSCRPDFMIPIYAAYLGDKDDPTRLSPLVKIDEQTPPTFTAVTLDDKWRGVHAALLLVELKKAGVEAECHVFARGGHGYGLRPSSNPVSGWPKLCESWMRSTGLLRPADDAL